METPLGAEQQHPTCVFAPDGGWVREEGGVADTRKIAGHAEGTCFGVGRDMGSPGCR